MPTQRGVAPLSSGREGEVAPLKVHDKRDPLFIIPADNLGCGIIRMGENLGFGAVGEMILPLLSMVIIMSVAPLMTMIVWGT